MERDYRDCYGSLVPFKKIEKGGILCSPHFFRSENEYQYGYVNIGMRNIIINGNAHGHVIFRDSTCASIRKLDELEYIVLLRIKKGTCDFFRITPSKTAETPQFFPINSLLLATYPMLNCFSPLGSRLNLYLQLCADKRDRMISLKNHIRAVY